MASYRYAPSHQIDAQIRLLLPRITDQTIARCLVSKSQNQNDDDCDNDPDNPARARRTRHVDYLISIGSGWVSLFDSGLSVSRAHPLYWYLQPHVISDLQLVHF